MADILIITDNEWEGKYQLVEQLFLAGGIDGIFSLGDNLPTGKLGSTGKGSFFKKTLKELAEKDPDVKKMVLAEQLRLVYNASPTAFMEEYSDAPMHVKEGAQFLRQSRLPVIRAITGNREFDYQALLDFIAERTGKPRVGYMEESLSCKRFDLRTLPSAELRCNTGILLLPYSPKPKESQKALEDSVRALRNMQPRSVVVMTHENPDPAQLGIDRKVVMKEEMDYCLGEVGRMGMPAYCFCGHLDTNADAFDFRGVKVQPVSGSQAVFYSAESGAYRVDDIK